MDTLTLQMRALAGKLAEDASGQMNMCLALTVSPILYSALVHLRRKASCSFLTVSRKIEFLATYQAAHNCYLLTHNSSTPISVIVVCHHVILVDNRHHGGRLPTAVVDDVQNNFLVIFFSRQPWAQLPIWAVLSTCRPVV